MEMYKKKGFLTLNDSFCSQVYMCLKDHGSQIELIFNFFKSSLSKILPKCE